MNIKNIVFSRLCPPPVNSWFIMRFSIVTLRCSFQMGFNDSWLMNKMFNMRLILCSPWYGRFFRNQPRDTSSCIDMNHVNIMYIMSIVFYQYYNNNVLIIILLEFYLLYPIDLLWNMHRSFQYFVTTLKVLLCL